MISSLLCAVTLFSSVASHQTHRAMWVWHARLLMEDSAQQEQFFKFLDAPKGDPSHQISVIFLARTGIQDEAQTANLQKLIAKAHEHSVRVDYLCGEAYYAERAHRKEGLWQLEYVLRYNKHAPAESRFDGIQYDVEPYMLPKWPASNVKRSYLHFLRAAKRRVRTSGKRLYLGVAIPRWFDGPDLHGLYKSVLDRADYVAVMDYVHTPEAFVHDGANTVKYGSAAGKDVWLGAEATELPDEPTATFYKLGNAAMEQAFGAAAKAFENEKGFAGVAVEYYETYLALRP